MGEEKEEGSEAHAERFLFSVQEGYRIRPRWRCVEPSIVRRSATRHRLTAAGVTVSQVELAPLGNIDTDQPFVLGEGKSFLAVTRFDRGGGQYIHCEDFAQIMGVPTEQKYTPPTPPTPPWCNCLWASLYWVPQCLSRW